MQEDYYKILEVDRGASQADIEKAYRKLARKHHPDLNPDDKTAKEKFQKVQHAFEVLKDPEKREMYDRYGSSFESMGAGGTGPHPFTGGGPQGFEFDFSQFFGERFGAGGPAGSTSFEDFLGGGPRGATRARPRRMRGRDIRHELKIPFSSAVLGGEAQLSVRRADDRIETIQVKIPAGVDDGQTIRLRGQGEASPDANGESGDILITVRVSPHPCFRRSGNNLEIRVPVSIAEATLGGKVEIPSPTGVITLTVPPGTSSGAKLRIKGHGVQPAGRPAGDLLAEIQIALPQNLDAETQELVRRLDQQYTRPPRSDLRW
ncbi:MAG: DnaJ domain-containing protein [Planctomycetales bacterium]|nr:DnaJ domain-containing protein [Planctomycetales bacterium]NIM09911.1 DnaJ domain-containing protein [Planctomycetales bacterium]NIN09350.1 DnaJ domain-containing protein [Planctomycetales bacterium]NIN78460.1 DnaJ domain-containing protein [Planctomycetales bacterium]NIO35650.1 DnaJ domain-containing protein [Planctomycetales bacterium]